MDVSPWVQIQDAGITSTAHTNNILVTQVDENKSGVQKLVLVKSPNT